MSSITSPSGVYCAIALCVRVSIIVGIIVVLFQPILLAVDDLVLVRFLIYYSIAI